jgi:enediyne biosynthesis protein E4
MDTIERNEPNLHYRETPLLLRNDRGKKLMDVSAASGEVFRQEWASRGMAIGDINNDGKMDVAVTELNGSAHLLLNQTTTSNHWIIFSLVGTKSNRDAIGAQVKVSTESGDQYGTVTTTSSYQSSSDKRLHFGLGGDAVIRQVEIQWPSGIRQTLKEVQADRILSITEPAK